MVQSGRAVVQRGHGATRTATPAFLDEQTRGGTSTGDTEEAVTGSGQDWTGRGQGRRRRARGRGNVADGQSLGTEVTALVAQTREQC